MKPDGQARVDRLVEWLKENRKSTLKGETVDAGAFLKEAGGRLAGKYSYWQSIFTKEASKSFGPAQARKVEQAFDMRPHLLDGAQMEWPFSEALGVAISKLHDEDLRHAENALRAHLKMDWLPPSDLGGGQNDTVETRPPKAA